MVQLARAAAERARKSTASTRVGRLSGRTDALVQVRNCGLWWFAVVLMRLLAGHLLVPIVGALLVFTTPVGTGQGVHENELLHPIWAHVHLIDGRIVSDEQMAAARAAATPDDVTSRTPAGPALGAGNGADALGLGIGIGPTLPILALTLPGAPESQLLLSENEFPTEFRDSPQDPPPDPLA